MHQIICVFYISILFLSLREECSLPKILFYLPFEGKSFADFDKILVKMYDHGQFVLDDKADNSTDHVYRSKHLSCSCTIAISFMEASKNSIFTLQKM